MKHRHHNPRSKARMALLCGAGIAPLVALIAAMFVVTNQDVPPPAVASTFVPMNNAATAQPDRPVYQYSVIPGGVYSAEELQSVLATDSVAADHHRDIVLDAVHPAQVPMPRLVYMSYRVGNEIAWTKHRVLLPAGETVLTDGVNEIRARCGNGISDVPRQPTSNAEPHPAAFESLAEPITYASSGPGPIGGMAPPLGSSALNLSQFAAPTLAPLGGGGDPGGVFPPSLVPLGGMTSFASPGQRLNPNVLSGPEMPLAPQVLQAPSASPDGDDQLPPDVPNDDALEEDGPDDGAAEQNVPGHVDDPDGVQPPPASSNDPGLVSEIIDPVVDDPNVFEPGVPIIDWPEEHNPPDSHSIPEPATVLLVGAGVAATMVRQRRTWRRRGEKESCRR